MKIKRLAALTLLSLSAATAMAATVDGYPSWNVNTDSGLFVWRTWDGRWQVRLMGGSRFNGSFESGGSINSVQRVDLEAGDLTDVVGNALNLLLNTGQGYLDGVTFDAGADSLCLRSEPDSTMSQVFLGRNRVPASFPIDLTESGACDQGGEGGLYIERLTRTEWKVRLQASGDYLSFAGVFDVSEPIVSFNPVSLEPRDRVFLSAPNSLNVSLGAVNNGFDGADFSITEFAKVCLRAESGGAADVYLGSPDDPIPATTPVDLTNNGACGLPASPFPPPTYGKKFNSGHYVFLTRRVDSQAIMSNSVRPGVRGFAKRWTWRDLEPTRGEYEFSEVRSDLDHARSLGMQLVVFIEDKTFVDEVPVPGYLAQYAVPNRPGGYSLMRWQPEVVDRSKALLAALADEFDSHPALEGIAIQESALGIADDVLAQNGYTAAIYRDALIETLVSGAQSFEDSRIFWFMNFLPQGNHLMGDVLRAVAPHGVIMGGPDVLPDNEALQNQTYPFYQYALGKMPIFTQVEQSCYEHEHADTSYPTTYWTPQELFEWGRDNLFVNYVFWVRITWRRYPDSYNWFDALPVIRNNPVFNTQ